jgi:hypothetical protein
VHSDTEPYRPLNSGPGFNRWNGSSLEAGTGCPPQPSAPTATLSRRPRVFRWGREGAPTSRLDGVRRSEPTRGSGHGDKAARKYRLAPNLSPTVPCKGDVVYAFGEAVNRSATKSSSRIVRSNAACVASSNGSYRTGSRLNSRPAAMASPLASNAANKSMAVSYIKSFPAHIVALYESGAPEKPPIPVNHSAPFASRPTRR